MKNTVPPPSKKLIVVVPIEPPRDKNVVKMVFLKKGAHKDIRKELNKTICRERIFDE